MRYNLPLFAVALIFNSAPSRAQVHVWSNSIGGSSIDHARAVAIADDGSVVTVGEFNGTMDLDPGTGVFSATANGSADAYVRKLDSNGDFLWAGTLGGSNVDGAFDVALDAGGNVLVVGTFAGTADLDIGAGELAVTSSNTTSDVFVLKLDPDGNTLWARSIGGPTNDLGRAIAVDVSGRVHVAGAFGNTLDVDPGAGTNMLTSAGMADAFVLCLDAAGEHQWGYGWGGIQDDRALGIAVAGAGYAYITGEFRSTVDLDPTAGSFPKTSNGAEDLFVVRLDPTGAFTWAVAMGGTGLERGAAIAADATGACVITGDMDSPTDIDPGAGTIVLEGSSFEDAMVVKLEPNGTLAWGFLLEGFLNDGLGAAMDNTGNVYIGGEYNGTTDMDPSAAVANLTTQPGPNGFVASYTSAGTFRFAFRCGSITNDVGVNSAFQLAAAGQLQGTSDMDPGTGVASLSSNGSQDAFTALYGDITTGIMDQAGRVIFLAYPNPTSGSLRVHAARPGSSFSVFDPTGRAVLGGVLMASDPLDLSTLPTGLYTLAVADGEGQRTIRVMVQR